MITHAQIWNGVDRLAKRLSLSPSGLAKLAGLDPTAFNKSKRFSATGEKPRWPSTESIAKVLEATGVSFPEFAALATSQAGVRRRAPMLSFTLAGDHGLFDEAGFPSGPGWKEIDFPGAPEESVYALEISGSALAPTYRDGDRIIVAPGQPLRDGDRVVVKTTQGEVLASELGRATSRQIEFFSLNASRSVRRIDVSEIEWIARILWASQ